MIYSVASYSKQGCGYMQTQSLEFLKLLYKAEKDMNFNIEHTEEKLNDYKVKLQQIKSAIVNLEAERQSTE